MKKLLFAMALLSLSCGAAHADTLQFSPDSQSDPVLTTATFTLTNFTLQPGSLELIEIGFSVTSGPDMGQGLFFVTTCVTLCAITFNLQNNGTTGTDSIEGSSTSLSNGTFGSATGAINWTASTVPEPSSLASIGAGLIALLLGRRLIYR
jgi:hypothetical protein